MPWREANNQDGSARRFTALLGLPLLRRMRSSPLLAGTFLIVILITAAAVSAVPMILNRVGDEGLLESMQNAMVIQRGISLNFDGRMPTPDGDPLAPVSDRGERYQENLTEPVRRLISSTEWVLDSARHDHLNSDLSPAAGPIERYFQFRYQSRLDDRIELIEGRRPEPADPIMLSAFAEPGADDEDRETPRFEVMIGAGTAEIMNLGVGDIFPILGDREDRLNRGAPRTYFTDPIAVEVVGIFEPVEPQADYWYSDYRTYRTDVYSNPEQSYYYSMGIPSPDALEDLMALNDPGNWRYNWRYLVEPDAVDIAAAPETATELQTLVQNRGPYEQLSEDMRPSDASRQVTIRTMLASLLSGAERQYRVTSAVLSLVVAGILSIGVALSGMLGALIASRRTPEIALIRSRGGSARQLSLAQIAEGLILGIPAAGVGLVLAMVITGRSASPSAVLAAGVVAVAGTVATWALTRRIWAVDLGSLLGRRAGAPAGSEQRRIVAELVIVGLAIAGVILLRQRGVTTGAAQQGFDPYIAAVPVLVGVATGIIAVRVFPWFLRQLARYAGRRDDIVPFLGLRRIAEPSLGRHLPLVVMILALGMAIFAGAIWYSIETPEIVPIEEAAPGETITLQPAPAGVNDAFRDGINLGFWLTIFMAGIYAALAVVCALALTADERQRDVGYLRTLGASRQQALGLTLIEQIPSALLAGVLGAALGALLTWLIAPGLDINSLYPAEQSVVIGVNWFLAIGQSLMLIIVAAGSATLFAIAARRTDLNDVLRAGE